MYQRQRKPYQQRRSKRNYAAYRRKPSTLRQSIRNKYNWRAVPNPITSDVMYGKLKYNYHGSVSGSSTATPLSYVFRGNSCYDPDQATGGHQPLGFDQWMTFYDKCVVLSSKITWRIFNTTTEVCQYTLYPSRTDTPASGQYTGLREIPYSKTATSGDYDHSGNDILTISNYMSTAKIFCISKQEVKDNAIYGHSSGGNPTNQWYWILTTAAQSQPTMVKSYEYDVEVTYWYMFKDRAVISDGLDNNAEEE